eukprot:TRINITY_DN776_c0_g1_i1.p1 TRINITY_DN776_c0_g1~~TRINITY_DN776_c0_g1_i1.p1  ORF type:complete len:1429 (+),score=359.30 TRINITY_DN776_c0_g1_i1:91-4377(+)
MASNYLKAILLLASLVHLLHASHLRSGTIYWAQTTGNTVQITVTIGLRLSSSSTYAGSSLSTLTQVFFGDGTNVNPAWTLAAHNTAEDSVIATAVVTHAYATTGPFTVYSSVTARVTGNNNSGALRLQTVVDLSVGTRSPVAAAFPTIYVPANAMVRIPVKASDPTGTGLIYRFSTPTEMGVANTTNYIPPGLVLENVASGTLIFNTTGVKTGLWNTQLTVTADGATCAIDFLMNVMATARSCQVGCSNQNANCTSDSHCTGCPGGSNVGMCIGNVPPQLTSFSTPNEAQYCLANSQTISFEVSFVDVNSTVPYSAVRNGDMSVMFTVMPAGATLTTTEFSVDMMPAIKTVFSWVATGSGNFPVCFAGRDTRGLMSETMCTTLFVVTAPPAPTVIGVSPTGIKRNGNSTITVVGNNLAGFPIPSCYVNGVQTDATLTSISTYSCTAPAGDSFIAMPVMVSGACGLMSATAGSLSVYDYWDLSASYVSPTQVRVNGTFMNVPAPQCRYQGVVWPATVVDSTTLTCDTVAANAITRAGVLSFEFGGNNADWTPLPLSVPPVVSSAEARCNITHTVVAVRGAFFDATTSCVLSPAYAGVSMWPAVMVNSTYAECTLPTNAIASVQVSVNVQGLASASSATVSANCLPGLQTAFASCNLTHTVIAVLGTLFDTTTMCVVSPAYAGVSMWPAVMVNSTYAECTLPTNAIASVQVSVNVQGLNSASSATVSANCLPSLDAAFASCNFTHTVIAMRGTLFDATTSCVLSPAYAGVSTWPAVTLNSTYAECALPTNAIASVQVSVNVQGLASASSATVSANCQPLLHSALASCNFTHTLIRLSGTGLNNPTDCVFTPPVGGVTSSVTADFTNSSYVECTLAVNYVDTAVWLRTNGFSMSLSSANISANCVPSLQTVLPAVVVTNVAETLQLTGARFAPDMTCSYTPIAIGASVAATFHSANLVECALPAVTTAQTVTVTLSALAGTLVAGTVTVQAMDPAIVSVTPTLLASHLPATLGITGSRFYQNCQCSYSPAVLGVSSVSATVFNSSYIECTMPASNMVQTVQVTACQSNAVTVQTAAQGAVVLTDAAGTMVAALNGSALTIAGRSSFSTSNVVCVFSGVNDAVPAEVSLTGVPLNCTIPSGWGDGVKTVYVQNDGGLSLPYTFTYYERVQMRGSDAQVLNSAVGGSGAIALLLAQSALGRSVNFTVMAQNGTLQVTSTSLFTSLVLSGYVLSPDKRTVTFTVSNAPAALQMDWIKFVPDAGFSGDAKITVASLVAGQPESLTVTTTLTMHVAPAPGSYMWILAIAIPGFLGMIFLILYATGQVDRLVKRCKQCLRSDRNALQRRQSMRVPEVTLSAVAAPTGAAAVSARGSARVSVAPEVSSDSEQSSETDDDTAPLSQHVSQHTSRKQSTVSNVMVVTQEPEFELDMEERP